MLEVLQYTVEPLIKDTPNKGHLSIKDKNPCPNMSFIRRFHCTMDKYIDDGSIVSLCYIMYLCHRTYALCMSCIRSVVTMDRYSGTSLIQTPLGQKKVPVLERCPHFRG